MVILNEKMIESLVIGHQSIWIGFLVNKEAQAATPSVLNIMLPMIALNLKITAIITKANNQFDKISHPISESATKVEIVLAKNSGIVVAVAIKVDAR